MCMTVDFTNIRLENKKNGKRDDTYIYGIHHSKLNTNMTCNEHNKKKKVSFVTNHKSYLHIRQYPY